MSMNNNNKHTGFQGVEFKRDYFCHIIKLDTEKKANFMWNT